MKKVYSALNLPDAHIVANLLIQAGIVTRVFNANAAGALGELPVDSAQPQLWVERDNDEARARALIVAFQSANIRTEQRACQSCGELNPGNFETCWNCAAVFNAY